MKVCCCTLPYSDPTACSRCPNMKKFEFDSNNFQPCANSSAVRRDNHDAIMLENKEVTENGTL